MKRNDFYFLAVTGETKLAGAYAILMDNAECALLRSFEDISYLTYRLKVAEDLIKNEKESEFKKKIANRIEWHKSDIRRGLEEHKYRYASMLTAERAEYRHSRELYDKIVKMIESEEEYDNFYEWIWAIDGV